MNNPRCCQNLRRSWAFLPYDEKIRTLRYLVKHRRKLVGERTRLSDRLTALLKGYFPQVLNWFPDLRTLLVCDFLSRWPTLDEVKRVRTSTLEAFFRKHNSNRKQAVENRINSIRESKPLTTDKAVIKTSAMMARAMAAQVTLN